MLFYSLLCKWSSSTSKFEKIGFFLIYIIMKLLDLITLLVYLIWIMCDFDKKFFQVNEISLF